MMDPSSRRDKQAEDKNNGMMKRRVELIRYKTEPFSFFIHWLNYNEDIYLLILTPKSNVGKL